MADLANAPGRRTASRRLTNNRSNILPARRDTDAPSLVVRADMRTASRGDGGADELRRVLGGFTDAAVGFEESRIAGAAEGYREDAADGAAAAAAGGPAEEGRSSAFQQAYYRLRSESQFNTFSSDVAEQAEQMVNDGGDPEEVNAFVLGQFQAFNTDVLGGIPEPSARYETAVRLADLGRTLETNVGNRIRERVTEESVQALQGNIATDLTANRPIDFEGRFAQARALNLTPAKAKEVVMQGVVAFALDRDNPRPELINELLDSTQADGVTPSFNAAERIQLLNSYAQAENLKDSRERELEVERRDAFLVDLLPKALAGEHTTEAVHAAMLAGTIDPSDGQGLIGMLEGFRDQKVQGQVNEQFALDVEYRASMGRPYTNAQIMAFHREGRFGTGTAGYSAAIRALTPPSQRGGGAAAGRRPGFSTGAGMNVTEGRKYAWGEVQAMMVPDDDASPYDRRMNAEIASYFNSQMDGRRGRHSPEVALANTRQFVTNAHNIRAQRGRGGPAAAPAASSNYSYDSQGRLVPSR